MPTPSCLVPASRPHLSNHPCNTIPYHTHFWNELGVLRWKQRFYLYPGDPFAQQHKLAPTYSHPPVLPFPKQACPLTLPPSLPPMSPLCHHLQPAPTARRTWSQIGEKPTIFSSHPSDVPKLSPHNPIWNRRHYILVFLLYDMTCLTNAWSIIRYISTTII